MLKQLALILAIIIVALLAIVAALTIVNRGPENEEGEANPPEVSGSRTTIMVSVGADGSQVEVGCRLPVEGQSPFLVTFENRTGEIDDYQARVLVRLEEGGRSTVVAGAPELRPGERRSVVPEPWLEPEGIIGCEVLALQGSDQVIILEDP
ncbi:MAG: hypothetical protein OES24_03965 [Acidimicrobiia bacterium]|nr:hypothetical protein [Acidimicrobiia bacterium]